MEINLIVIRTEQPEALANFYALLGVSFQYHRHGTGAWHYSAELGKIIFEIYPLLKNQTIADRSLRLGFTVKQLDDLIKKLRQGNIEIISEPKQMEWGYMAIIKDLDGRKIELKESII